MNNKQRNTTHFERELGITPGTTVYVSGLYACYVPSEMQGPDDVVSTWTVVNETPLGYRLRSTINTRYAGVHLHSKAVISTEKKKVVAHVLKLWERDLAKLEAEVSHARNGIAILQQWGQSQ